MASRRNIIITAKFLSRNPKPLYTPIFHGEVQAPSPISRFLASGFCIKATKVALHLQERTSFAFGNRPMLLLGSSSFKRHMSSTISEGLSAAEIVTEKSIELIASSQGSVASEVAIAAADSFYPVAIIQHLVDAVHSTTGFNWWASIALTTVLLSGTTTLLQLLEIKHVIKFWVMWPCFKIIFRNMMMGPEGLAKGEKQLKELLRIGGVTPVLVTLGGNLFGLSIFLCLHSAIRNMADKVPSFKTGGTLWFLDLTTPDASFILPTLTSIVFWSYVEIVSKNEDELRNGILIAIFISCLPDAPKVVKFSVLCPKVGTYKMGKSSDEDDLPLLDISNRSLNIYKALFFCMLPTLWFQHILLIALKGDKVKRFLGISAFRSPGRRPKK